MTQHGRAKQHARAHSIPGVDMEFVVEGVGAAAGKPSADRPLPADRRSRKHRRIEPYAWLAAGAVGVGIAAALAGAGVAYADDTGGSTSASSSASADTGPAKSRSGSSGTSTGSATGGVGASHNDTSDDDDRSGGNDNGSEDTDTDDSEVDEDLTGELSDDDLAESDEDPAGEDEPPAVDGTGDGSAPASPAPAVSSPQAQTNSSSGAATSRAASRTSADSTSATTQTALSVAVTDVDTAETAQTAAPTAPATLADLLRAFFVRWQQTYFNQTPTAAPSQHSGQSNNGAVTGTVGATDRDGDPLTVELTKGPIKGIVVVDADGKYTYTPSTELAATGGTDTFTVVVRELNASSHTHGLKGLLSTLLHRLTGAEGTPDDGSFVAKVVTVTIAQAAATQTAAVTGDPIKRQTITAAGPTATVPSKYDAGLSDPFLMPTAPSGKTYNVRDYGASSSWSLNDDAAAIQKAINAAKAGDVVYIPNGTYHLKSIISLKTGVSLIGQSRASTVLSAAFSTSPHAVIYGAPGVNNLTLSSFRITVSKGKIKAGIRLGTEGSTLVSNIAVKDIQIEKFERFGIQLQNAYQVLVEGNVIKNATALGGGGSGYGILIDQSLSSNNWIKNNTIGPVIRHAILVQESAHNNLIELNKITGTVSGAIDLHGEDEYANEIRYNTIANGVRNGTTVSPNGAGIEIGEYSGVIGTETAHDNSGPLNWVHHNTVYNYSYGMRITNNSNYTFVENNTFYNNVNGGIQADLAPLNNLYISNNQIYNNGSGIVLYDVTSAVLQSNTVRDNKNYGIWANPGTTGYFIYDNTVMRNRVNITLSSTNGSYAAPV